ncbi:unknown protein [Seminavis robusta]|uniref:HSF-type DNA-binding domain-containing protein n=1 Tax=Seminavis robusta TaxID=568900 RepID=A0A9N8HQE8_9STRA|nr:unknown protein [Seminavis robusta]|eukprot:Sro1279_g258860.1 n/a (148) ;mRNA; r:21581-22224
MSWNDFLEQLRRFGFRRLTNAGPDQGAFYHPGFFHGHPQLAEHIVYNEMEVAPLDRPGPTLAFMHPTPQNDMVPANQSSTVAESVSSQNRMMEGPVPGAPTLPSEVSLAQLLMQSMMTNNNPVQVGAAEDLVHHDHGPDHFLPGMLH